MDIFNNLPAFLSSLSRSERELLLAGLMTKTGNGYLLHQKTYPLELFRAERNLLDNIDRTSIPKILNSRLRNWFIFMLLRYGGMRLEEILDLEAENLELNTLRINIPKGRFPRTISLPPLATRQMRERLERWPALFVLKNPFRCDSSQIRRAFSRCASQCALSPGLLTARTLRRHRGLELEKAGLPLSLINLFLGRAIPDPDFDSEQGNKILDQFIQNEQFPKTSARNSFHGALISLKKKGILIETCLETASGMKVHAVITDTSRQNLNLEEGMAVTALVKAPWVNVYENISSEPNHFYGKIKEIKEDSSAVEIIVIMDTGNIVCSLYTLEQKPDFPLYAGKDVGVKFSPMSVILTSG